MNIDNEADYKTGTKKCCGSLFNNRIIYALVSFLAIHTAFFLLEHVHYACCVPHGISGFFKSMIVSNSPPCIGLRWVSRTLSTTAINLIYLIGTIIIASITTFTSNNITPSQSVK